MQDISANCFLLLSSALTTDDEKRQLSLLITSFIHQVNFGNDFEQQLDFYVNARAAFSNLDSVLVSLVQVKDKSLMVLMHNAFMIMKFFYKLYALGDEIHH